jgi:release factor glutamine methyltransferase
MQQNIKTLFLYIKKTIELANIPNAALEARLLIAHFLQITLEEMIVHFTSEAFLRANSVNLAALNIAVAQRCQHKPMAYLLGYKNFFGRDFIVNEATLIPRSDSECLITAMVKYTADCKNSNLIDLGTGTGCLGITAALETHGIAQHLCMVDISGNALTVAKQNAAKHGIMQLCSFMEADFGAPNFGDNLSKKYDILISNPPYISTEDVFMLDKSVQQEPHLALDGGIDGLVYYRIIANIANKIVQKNGLMFLEIGCTQMQSVCEILLQHSLEIIDRIQDLEGRDRVIVAKI